MCLDCRDLNGKPAAVEPHKMLFGERATVRADGLLAQFRCRACHTYWERFNPNENYTGAPQVWRIV